MLYKDLIGIVNNYMDESGIRNHCRDVCRGTCCANCFQDNPDYLVSCYNIDTCESRLPCVLYLCDYAEAHVINYTSNGLEIVDILRKTCSIVRNKLYELYDINKPVTVYELDSSEHQELEFDIPSISVLLDPELIEVFINE